MSRWLDLARSQTAFDSSTDPTNSTNPPEDRGNVGFVGNVETLKAPQASHVRLAYSASDADDDAVALDAIRAGDRSYGAVATTTGMGATRAYKAVERLLAAGRVGQDMKVTEASE